MGGKRGKAEGVGNRARMLLDVASTRRIGGGGHMGHVTKRMQQQTRADERDGGTQVWRKVVSKVRG